MGCWHNAGQEAGGLPGEPAASSACAGLWEPSKAWWSAGSLLGWPWAAGGSRVAEAQLCLFPEGRKQAPPLPVCSAGRAGAAERAPAAGGQGPGAGAAGGQSASSAQQPSQGIHTPFTAFPLVCAPSLQAAAPASKPRATSRPRAPKAAAACAGATASTSTTQQQQQQPEVCCWAVLGCLPPSARLLPKAGRLPYSQLELRLPGPELLPASPPCAAGAWHPRSV